MLYDITLYIYIYIYIERERCVYIYIYIYIYMWVCYNILYSFSAENRSGTAYDVPTPLASEVVRLRLSHVTMSGQDACDVSCSRSPCGDFLCLIITVANGLWCYVCSQTPVGIRQPKELVLPLLVSRLYPSVFLSHLCVCIYIYI